MSATGCGDEGGVQETATGVRDARWRTKRETNAILLPQNPAQKYGRISIYNVH